MTIFLKNLDLDKVKESQPRRPRAQHDKNASSSFPIKLHQVLDDLAELQMDNIAQWSNNGKAFQIINSDLFTNDRQLQTHGFSKITSGPMEGCYSHPLFIRGDIKSIVKIPGDVGRRQPTGAAWRSAKHRMIKHNNDNHNQGNQLKRENQLIPFNLDDEPTDGILNMLFENSIFTGEGHEPAQKVQDQRQCDRLSFGGKYFYALPSDLVDKHCR
eukprot:Nitzschia sp. Nitz4//scaffold78_size91513//80973//81662//NITZ4_004939-RA/size91513-processed-gene-0.96-mRNA-1//-1//CDS//3329558160//3645//frame0